MKTFEEHLAILYDEHLIAELETGKDICDISINKLRSPTMRALHNIWSSDLDAQTCSDFAGDPDGLARFLIRRDQMKTTQFEKRVTLVMKHIGSEATVQSNLMNYTKS